MSICFDDGLKGRRKPQLQYTCFEYISVSNDKDISLWHFRLGHPSFRYLKFLFPKLFINEDSSTFQCEVCELTKHHHSSFPSQPYKPSTSFPIIHSDVWGPNRMRTLSHKC